MLDASIPLQVKQFQLDSPVQQFGNALAIQSSMSKNALADLQMSKLKRDISDEEADRAAIVAAGGDLEGARNALLQRGRIKPAMEISKQLLEQRKTLAAILKDEAETNLKHLGVLSSVLAPLSTKTDITLDDVAGLLTTAKAAGVPDKVIKNIASAVPKNTMALPAFVRNLAMTTESGRKTLEMALPKITMQDTGGVIQPVNTNTLAGPVGPLEGAGTIAKTNTPGEVLTDTRTREQMLETARHNKVSESNSAANTAISAGNLGVSRDRLNFEKSQPKLHYDAERGVLVNERTGAASPVTQGGTPLPPKQPEFAKKEAASIEAQANTVTKALEYAKATPEAFGLVRGAATAAGSVPEALAMKASSTEANEARAFVFNVVSKVINERAGAAQSKQELARLRGFLPSEYDDAKVITDKLQGFQKYLAEQGKAYAPKSASGASGVPKITGDDEFARLPSGTEFIGPDGVRRRKP